MLTSTFEMDILIFLRCLITDVYNDIYFKTALQSMVRSQNSPDLKYAKSDFPDISSIVTGTPMKSSKLNVYPLKTVAIAQSRML